MLSILAPASVVVVALLHLGFMVLEATQWNTPLGRKLTDLSEEAARETVGVGINMGIYNGFLGAALLWVTFAWGVREAYSAQWPLLTFIVFAGVVGTITMRNRGILVLQSLPRWPRFCSSGRTTPERGRTGRGPAGDVQASAQTWPILE